MATAAKYKIYNGSSWDELTFTPSSHTHTWANITNAPTILDGNDISTVADLSSYDATDIISAPALINTLDYYAANDHDHDSTYAKKANGIYYIVGTGTTAGTWLGSCDDITEYYDGLTIAYKLNIAGASTTTLNINGLGAKTIYLRGTTKLTTQYAVDTVIIAVYTTVGGAGRWYVNDYDANSYAYVRQYTTTTNADYPLLLAYETTAPSSYNTKYTRLSSTITANPSTGTITATTLNADNIELTGNITFPQIRGLSGTQGVIGFNDEGIPTIIEPDRRLAVGTDDLAGDYYYYTFPEKEGTVALLSDIPTSGGSSQTVTSYNITGQVYDGGCAIDEDYETSLCEDELIPVNEGDIIRMYIYASSSYKRQQVGVIDVHLVDDGQGGLIGRGNMFTLRSSYSYQSLLVESIVDVVNTGADAEVCIYFNIHALTASSSASRSILTVYKLEVISTS